MSAPIQPIPPPPVSTDPTPVVARTHNQQWRRVLSYGSTFIGAALHVLSQYGPQIAAHYPAVKWIGDAVFLGGLGWAAWQQFSDMHQITGVNYSPPADGGGGV